MVATEVVVHNFAVELDSFSLTESQLFVECCRSVEDDDDGTREQQTTAVRLVAGDLGLIAEHHWGCNYCCCCW